jgi:murein DD-endopeptidase MepM/ murein hydrolase activator NlpD
LKPLVKKQISFLLFDEADYSTRQFAVSQGVLVLAVLFIIAAFCLTGYAALRCASLRETITSTALMEEASRDQRHLVSVQSRQISLLNEKIAGLTEKFEHLQSLKKEICRIGRIEQPVGNENLFGVGGSRVDNATRTVSDAKSGGTGKGPEPNATPGTNDSGDIPSDPSALSGSAVVLNPSDFHINPIACVPSSLPMNGTVSTPVRSSREFNSVGENFHCGILMETVQGDEILAPANGIVTFADVRDGAGETVIIDHGHGFVTRYTGLTSTVKEMGALVLKGEVLGLAKKSHSSTPSRFYYEILVDGLPVHPEKYIAHASFLL